MISSAKLLSDPSNPQCQEDCARTANSQGEIQLHTYHQGQQSGKKKPNLNTRIYRTAALKPVTADQRGFQHCLVALSGLPLAVNTVCFITHCHSCYLPAPVCVYVQAKKITKHDSFILYVVITKVCFFGLVRL